MDGRIPQGQIRGVPVQAQPMNPMMQMPVQGVPVQGMPMRAGAIPINPNAAGVNSGELGMPWNQRFGS